jgi:hypothetical protein
MTQAMNLAGRIAATLTACLALAACTEHQTKTAERAVSPLIGTWTRDGDTPKPNASAPQFTKLTFAADGKLTARYVEAGGALAPVLNQAPKFNSENDTYSTNDSTLNIAEGTRKLTFTYRVDGGKLYLTPPGGSDAAVFSKSS